MKLVKRISLFCVVGGILFLSGSYVTIKMEQFFYPNRYEREQTQNEARHEIGQEIGREAEIKEEQVIEAIVEEIPVITADTKYLIEEVNLSDGTIEEKEEVIPVKYIGLDRESLMKELKYMVQYKL